MPKVKTISRTEKDFERETKNDIMKVYRSTNKLLHPFQKVSKKILKKRQGNIKEQFLVPK